VERESGSVMNDNECPRCGSMMSEEVAFLVSGQVNGPRATIKLLVCDECGHTMKGEDNDEATTNISEGDRS
jgi:uncharacterized Zn finger protein